MGDRTPRRKASIASSASSGATIKPSNSQISGSNGGFFARFRSSSQSRSGDGYGSGDGEDSDPEAGPSDYYRRSPSPLGWATPSNDVEGEGEADWSGPQDRQKPDWEDSQSEAPTPDADDSISVDMMQYQKRLRDVLEGTRADTSEEMDGDIGSEGAEGDVGEIGGLLEKVGIGEEEFGGPSPSSTAPSTPQKNPRQVSYIRMFGK